MYLTYGCSDTRTIFRIEIQFAYRLWVLEAFRHVFERFDHADWVLRHQSV